MKYIILIGDGMCDYPLDELDGLTPLEKANTPNMDLIAKKGKCGFTNNVPKGYTPGSDVANMSIFGFNPEDCYTGRGPLEAGNMSIETDDNDVIFRCNLITESNGTLDDFNANHISTEEAALLINDLNIFFNEKYNDFKGHFYPGVSYRHVFVYRCDNEEESDLLSNMLTFPPHDITGELISDYTDWFGPVALEIKNIMDESKQLLENHPVNIKRREMGKKPANMVWLWGQGISPQLGNFKDIYGLNGAVITGVDLLKGIGAFGGLDIIDVPGATAYFDTDYDAKGRYALDTLKDHDLVIIHVESPDEAGHAKDLDEKIKAIESIDKYVLGQILDNLDKFDNYKIAVLPDHPTPIPIGTHTNDDVPIAIYSTTMETSDDCEVYSEKEFTKGTLKKKPGYTLIDRLIKDDF